MQFSQSLMVWRSQIIRKAQCGVSRAEVKTTRALKSELEDDIKATE